MKLSRKQREVLEALAAGTVLWREITGCHIVGCCEVDWDTFDQLAERELIETHTSKSVGLFRWVFVIADAGCETNEGHICGAYLPG